MALLNSYALWNNKGGVGKSTITFHLAVRYAEQHPSHQVLVIDLCPQANSSMMLLGGGTDGEQRVLSLCGQSQPPTVVGYTTEVLSRGPGASLPDPSTFITQACSLNDRMPKNLHLLCGDGNLEPMAPLISERALQAPLGSGDSPWKWVHLIFRRLIEQISSDPKQEWLVLVDTNPSFSVYTEIAITSIDRLIVPVNADDASRVATNAMFTLIYGSNPPHPFYGQYTYAERASKESLPRPLVHLIVGNRLTHYDGPAKAFGAISDATAQTLYSAFQTHPDRFSPAQTPISSSEEFRTNYSVPLRDFNTAGVVAAHRGMRLSGLSSGNYDVYGQPVTVTAARAQECLEAVDAVVDCI